MNRHLSVRRRIELLLPIYALQDVVKHGANEDPEKERCSELLRAARDTIIDGRDDVIRRAMRTYHRTIWCFYSEGAQVDQIGLGIYFWLKALTEADYLVIGTDELGQALDLILPALEHAVERSGTMERGQEMGQRILSVCQADGYYPAVSKLRG